MWGRLARSRALKALAHTRVGGWALEHREQEETVAVAVGLNVVWRILVVLLGAGVAAAAITSTGGSTYHPRFTLSTKGAAFIARFEGLRTTPYNDPFNCTVGVGHLIHMGPCRSYEYLTWRITSAQAMTMLMHDAATAEGYVRRYVTHPINQAQFDALVSFTFNCGGGTLEASSLLRAINSGELGAVPRLFTRYSYASGHYLAGLHTRRIAEGVLFSSGYYGSGIGRYVPSPEQKLRARRGYYSWLAWALGEGAWRHYGASNHTVRPDVPAHVPRTWWRRRAKFLKARASSPAAHRAVLKAKTGYWSWLAWYLGEGAWKPYGRLNGRVRPHVPARVSSRWWRQERAFVAKRGAK